MPRNNKRKKKLSNFKKFLCIYCGILLLAGVITLIMLHSLLKDYEEGMPSGTMDKIVNQFTPDGIGKLLSYNDVKVNEFETNDTIAAYFTDRLNDGTVSYKKKAGEYSEPFLFSGWDYRMAWVKNDSSHSVSFAFEVDKKGNNQWTPLREIKVEAGESVHILFDKEELGEWIRVKTDAPTLATVSFTYTDSDERSTTSDEIFEGLAELDCNHSIGGLLYSLGNNRRALGIVSTQQKDGKVVECGYYEMNDTLKLVRKDDPESRDFIVEKCAIPSKVVTVESSSVLVVDDKGRRWRLPLGDEAYTGLMDQNALRICREVVTERDLFSCMGTFYELPAENADGYAKIRPVATHNYKINDYASYRGMMILTGVDPEEGKKNPHIIVSEDGKAAVWAGAIDDLWELGKPVGHGGPWNDTQVASNEQSDPYLIAFYDRKEMKLSHKSSETVKFTVEVDPTGNGKWMTYAKYDVKPGETFTYQFPDGFQSRWIRFSVDKNCQATALLNYR